MVGIGRFDEERSDEEPEQSEGNSIPEVSNLIFCSQKIPDKKEKQRLDKSYLSEPLLAFL